MPIFVAVAVGTEVYVVGARLGNLIVIVVIRIPAALSVYYLEFCVCCESNIRDLVFINIFFVEG